MAFLAYTTRSGIGIPVSSETRTKADVSPDSMAPLCPSEAFCMARMTSIQTRLDMRVGADAIRLRRDGDKEDGEDGTDNVDMASGNSLEKGEIMNKTLYLSHTVTNRQRHQRYRDVSESMFKGNVKACEPYQVTSIPV